MEKEKLEVFNYIMSMLDKLSTPDLNFLLSEIRQLELQQRLDAAPQNKSTLNHRPALRRAHRQTRETNVNQTLVA